MFVQAILQLAISLPVIFFYVALCITCACSLREATPSSQMLLSTQLSSLSPDARSAVRTAELHATSACTAVYAPTVKKLKVFISLGVTLLYIAIVFGIYNQYVNVGNFLLTIVARSVLWSCFCSVCAWTACLCLRLWSQCLHIFFHICCCALFGQCWSCLPHRFVHAASVQQSASTVLGALALMVRCAIIRAGVHCTISLWRC